MTSVRDWLLAIETSGNAGGVALARADEVVAERLLPGLRRNAAELLPAIHQLLNDHSIQTRELATIVFAGGPGSFTGIRVAATVARMLHSVCGTRVVRLSTLESIAQNALDCRDSCLLPMLDAKRGQIYSAAYRVEDLQPRELVAAHGIEPARMLASVAEIAPLSNWIALGDGVAACREILDAAGVRCLDESFWKPTAGGVARCGLRAVAAGRFATIAEMLPIYLRPPECEEVYESRRQAAMQRRGEGPLAGAQT